MNEDRTPGTYQKPAIESSSEVAGLLTFKSHKGKGNGNGPKGGGRGNHS